jgi:hypothetical protein
MAPLWQAWAIGRMAEVHAMLRYTLVIFTFLQRRCRLSGLWSSHKSFADASGRTDSLRKRPPQFVSGWRGFESEVRHHRSPRSDWPLFTLQLKAA